MPFKWADVTLLVTVACFLTNWNYSMILGSIILWTFFKFPFYFVTATFHHSHMSCVANTLTFWWKEHSWFPFMEICHMSFCILEKNDFTGDWWVPNHQQVNAQLETFYPARELNFIIELHLCEQRLNHFLVWLRLLVSYLTNIILTLKQLVSQEL